MKPYMVEITTYGVVMAEDEAHAHQVADSYKREIFGDDWNPRIEVDGAVVKVEDLAHGWDGECIPYGGDGNTKLADLLVPNQELPAFSTFAPEEAGEPIYRVTNNRGRRVALCFDESIAQLVRIAPDLLVLAESIANDKVRVDGPFARVAIERLQVHARAILGAMKP